MHFSLLYQTDAIAIVTIVFLLTILMTTAGHRVGRILSYKGKVDDAASKILQTGLYGLLAFLLGFTFSMAASRLEKSRAIIAEEANCIGTAILRADLYAEPERSALRVDFNEYLEARLSYYSKGANPEAIAASNAAAKVAGAKLWARVTQLSQDPAMLVESGQMVPALNAMFDITTIRDVNSQSMVPDQIMYMLFILTLCSGFLIGFTTEEFGTKSKILVIFNALLTSLVIYIILDLDRPKSGLITTYASDKAMTDLRKLLE